MNDILILYRHPQVGQAIVHYAPTPEEVAAADRKSHFQRVENDSMHWCQRGWLIVATAIPPTPPHWIA